MKEKKIKMKKIFAILMTILFIVMPVVAVAESRVCLDYVSHVIFRMVGEVLEVVVRELLLGEGRCRLGLLRELDCPVVREPGVELERQDHVRRLCFRELVHA
jgi:hypothetical protein